MNRPCAHILAAALAGTAALGAVGCYEPPEINATEDRYYNPATFESAELQVRTLEPAPEGARTLQQGDRVRLAYIGRLVDGRGFDTAPADAPWEVDYLREGNGGTMIPGFYDGLKGMKVGELRAIGIPPELGLGDKGSRPQVPKNARLDFEVRLLEILDAEG